MLTLKDLSNRVYRDKQCIGFEYQIKDNDNTIGVCQFQMILTPDDDNPFTSEWRMQVVNPRTRDKDAEVYVFGYVLPKVGLPLELIAATGLKYYQLHLKNEIQYKSNLDFILGDITKDVVG